MTKKAGRVGRAAAYIVVGGVFGSSLLLIGLPHNHAYSCAQDFAFQSSLAARRVRGARSGGDGREAVRPGPDGFAARTGFRTRFFWATSAQRRRNR